MIPSGLGWWLLPPEQIRGKFSSCIHQLDRNPAKISQEAGWKWQEEDPCTCFAVVPCREAETSLSAPLGSPKPAPWLPPVSCRQPHPQLQCWEGNPGEGSAPSWVARQARACLQRHREDGLRGIQLVRSWLWPEALSQPLLSPGDPIICFWPQFQALGQAKAVQVDCCSPRSSRGPSETKPTPARSRDGYK